jgi:uncharacterized protein
VPPRSGCGNNPKTGEGRWMMAWKRDMAWRRLDERGQERCVYLCEESMCALEGLGAVAINGSGLVFEYRMELSPQWVLRSAVAIAHLGPDEFSLSVERRDDASWYVNGARERALDSATDIDLSFTPSTNTLPIRRMGLAEGQEARNVAVLVSEPELRVSIVEQRYRRIDRYRYEFEAGDFSAVLEVDDDGIVQRYPGLFEVAVEAVQA